jgi:hypothetical protein
MADEVFELRQRVSGAAAPPTADGNIKLTRRLNRVAKRAEEIAAGLEQP